MFGFVSTRVFTRQRTADAEAEPRGEDSKVSIRLSSFHQGPKVSAHSFDAYVFC